MNLGPIHSLIDQDPLSLAAIPKSSSAVHIILGRLKQLMDLEIVHTLEKHGGIKIADWRILYVLATSGPMAQKDLIKTILMEQSHASRALKALHQSGLIEITRDQKDMRRWHFALSEKGLQLFNKIDPVMQSRRDFLDGALSDAELETLQDMATRVAKRTVEVLREQDSKNSRETERTMTSG